MASGHWKGSFLGIAALLMPLGVSSQPTGDPVPELAVMLTPAFGVVPLAPGEEMYTFQVRGEDRKHHVLYASVETYVRPGETRDVDKTTRGTHVSGHVNLSHAGVATYSAELAIEGRTIARTNAFVTVRGLR